MNSSCECLWFRTSSKGLDIALSNKWRRTLTMAVALTAVIAGDPGVGDAASGAPRGRGGKHRLVGSRSPWRAATQTKSATTAILVRKTPVSTTPA